MVKYYCKIISKKRDIMNIVIALSAIILLVSLGSVFFCYLIFSKISTENKDLKLIIKEQFMKLDNDNRIQKKELSNISAKIKELTEIDHME